jgi:serine/threonine protein kinase
MAMKVGKIANCPGRPPRLGVRRVKEFKFGEDNLIAASDYSHLYKQQGRCGLPMAVKVPSGSHDQFAKSHKDHPDYFIEHEAKVLWGLDQPNIIKCLGNGLLGGRLFLALEYIEPHRSAYDHVRGSDDREKALLFMLEGAAAALSYLHGRGIVHADIDSTNLITDEKVVKLVDFATARPAGKRLHWERGTWVFGRPAYMSLSRLNNNPPTKADDLYALGITACSTLLDGIVRFRDNCFAQKESRGISADRVRRMYDDTQRAFGYSIEFSPLSDPIKELLFRSIGVAGRAQFADAQEILEFIARIKRQTCQDHSA